MVEPRHRSPTAFLFTLLFAIGCGATPGDGIAATESRLIETPFEAIRVNDAIVVELRLRTGASNMVEVIGDSNIVPLIQTEVVDGVLRISADDIEPTIVPVIRLEMERLMSASAAGEGSAIIATGIDQGDGADTLGIGLSEGATGEFLGDCHRLIAIVTGLSTLRASRLDCEHGELDVMEGAAVQAHFKQSVVVRASGQSRVRIFGDPPDVEEDLSNGATLAFE